MLDSMKDAFHRWTNRLFHRSDKRRSPHPTPNHGRTRPHANQNLKVKDASERNTIQPSSELQNPPQETSTLGTSTNANEQNTAPASPLIKCPHQPSGTLDAQPSSAIENQAPFSDGKKTSPLPQCSRNVVHDSQVADATVSKNQQQSPRRQPQGTQYARGLLQTGIYQE